MSVSAPVIVASLLALLTQQTARDPRPRPLTGTGAIGGRVITNDEMPQAVRRARLLVTRSDGEVTRSVFTDGEGRFMVTELPAGRYTVSATKAGWLRAAHGAARPGRPGTAMVLAAAQRIPDLVLTMTRGGVVTGVVTDSMGRPAPGVLVRLLQFRFEAGERLLGFAAVAAGSVAELTDDRGEYRFYGLAPGEYAVGAAPPEVAPGPWPTRLMGGGTVGYAPVYYPGTPVAAEAGRVTVKSGEETSGISLTLQYVRTARIEGTIVATEDLSQQDVRITLTPDSPGPLVLGATPEAKLTAQVRMLATLGPDRKFSFPGVAPGRYTLLARAVERVAPRAGQSYVSAISGVTSLWAKADLVVDGTDLTGLSLTMQPGLTVSGKVTLEGTATLKPPPDIERVRLSLITASRPDGGFGAGFPAGSATATGEFIIKGVVPGTYRFGGSYANDLANGWSVKSALFKDRDLLDFPLEVTHENLTGVAVTMTRATQRVSGLLQDGGGRAAPGLTVVIFPADRAYWRVERRIRTARSGQDGRYALERLPIGEYLIAAVTDLEPGEASDPAFLEALVPASIAVSVRAGERKVQDLRVGR